MGDVALRGSAKCESSTLSLFEGRYLFVEILESCSQWYRPSYRKQRRRSSDSSEKAKQDQPKTNHGNRKSHVQNKFTSKGKRSPARRKDKIGNCSFSTLKRFPEKLHFSSVVVRNKIYRWTDFKYLGLKMFTKLVRMV